MCFDPNREACVWTSGSFPVPRSWVHRLSERQIDEITQAVREAQRRGRAFHQLDPQSFRIPETRALLESLSREVHEYPGFAVIGGLPVERMTRDEALLAYGGLMSHLGLIVDQSKSGDMLVEVKDAGQDYSSQSRAYHSNREIEFHTDGAVLTSLLCLGEALQGGASVLVSSMAVFKEFERRRPDLVQALVRGYHHHRRGEEAAGELPYSATRIPVLSSHNGLLQCTFDRRQIRWAQEAGAPVSADESEALDLFSAITKDPPLQLHMDMQLGDIQIVNNFTVMHARTQYMDGQGKKRLLIRLWIETPDGPRTGRTVRELYVKDSRRAATTPV